MLLILEGFDDVYNLVPLSRKQEVWNAYKAHVLLRSADEVGGEWRVCWFKPAAIESMVIVDPTKTTDGLEAMAILEDNPDALATQYTLLTVTTGNANFVANGVEPGDVVRYLFSLDLYGVLTYSEFIVDHVVNEDQLVLATGHTAVVASARRVE